VLTHERIRTSFCEHQGVTSREVDMSMALRCDAALRAGKLVASQ
jgi:hypothetical protein